MGHGGLTVTITAFSIVLYKRLSYDLYQSLDDMLQSRAEGIADSIDTFWEVEKLEAKKKRSAAASLSRANELNFQKLQNSGCMKKQMLRAV